MQTKQRHANSKALEHNGKLRSENEVLRSQNADLARELVKCTVTRILVIRSSNAPMIE